MSQAASDGAADRITVSRSVDGDRLAAVAELRSPDGRFSADPTVVLGEDGRAIVTWLGFRANLAEGGEPYDMRVYVARASENGRFGAPRELAGGDERTLYDRPTSRLSPDGSLLVAVREERAGHAGISLLSSRDDGDARRRALVEGDGFGGGLPSLCVSASTGAAYVTYVDPVHGVALVAAAESAPPAPPRLVSLPGEPVALEAPACVLEGDRLWLVYGLSAAPIDSGASASMSSLVLLRSSDRGLTFDRRARWVDETGELSHPAIVGDGEGGLVILAYVAARGGGLSSLRRLSVRASGETSVETVRAGLPLALRRNDPRWIGDYIGLGRSESGEWAAFGDAGSGLPRVVWKRLR